MKKKKTTHTICFANNKGGSGKSTTCANLGSALAAMGRKVLLVDGDMQLNLSLSFLDEEEVLALASGGKNLYTAVTQEKELSEFIIPSGQENIDLIPSSTLMSQIEMDLFPKWQREFILSKLLSGIKESGVYDYILIDAPPTLGGWVMNILIASDYVVVPVEATPWGLFGLANMFEFIGKIRQMAPGLSILGVLITKVDERKNYYHQTAQTLRELEDIRVFDNVIHVDSAIEWAQDASSTVVVYKRSARSAKEYLNLAKEVDQLCQ